MPTRVLRIEVTAADVAESGRRAHDEPLERCSPLNVALQRCGLMPVFTRRFVLLGAERWQPSRETSHHENHWSKIGSCPAYIAELSLAPKRVPPPACLELQSVPSRHQTLPELRAAVETWLDAFAADPGR